MIQGYHLEMTTYGICILALIKNLKREIPGITKTWYADNSGSLGTLARIETYCNLLTRQGPGSRYHIKQSKTILVVDAENLEAGKMFGKRHGFRVCMGAHYLGAYIGDNKSKQDWMREHRLM